jgi:hypothetical protein
MKYLKLFNNTNDAIYDGTNSKIYDSPGIVFLSDIDKLVYNNNHHNEKYYIDENLNTILYSPYDLSLVDGNSYTLICDNNVLTYEQIIAFSFRGIDKESLTLTISDNKCITYNVSTLETESGTLLITYTPIEEENKNILCTLTATQNNGEQISVNFTLNCIFNKINEPIIGDVIINNDNNITTINNNTITVKGRTTYTDIDNIVSSIDIISETDTISINNIQKVQNEIEFDVTYTPSIFETTNGKISVILHTNTHDIIQTKDITINNLESKLFDGQCPNGLVVVNNNTCTAECTINYQNIEPTSIKIESDFEVKDYEINTDTNQYSFTITKLYEDGIENTPLQISAMSIPDSNGNTITVTDEIPLTITFKTVAININEASPINLTVNADVNKIQTITVDLQGTTLSNCSVTSSNDNFLITKRSSSVDINFKLSTIGEHSTTITVTDNTYPTVTDSIIINVTVTKPTINYYLRYGVNDSGYNSWTDEKVGELVNNIVEFKNVELKQYNNYCALTKTSNDMNLKNSINLDGYNINDVNSLLYNGEIKEQDGKRLMRLETKNAGTYNITINLNDKTISITQ